MLTAAGWLTPAID